MSARNEPNYIGWIIVFSILLAILHSGIFFQTGQQWYDTCWASKHSNDGPKTANEAGLWAQCDYTSRKAIFDAGFILTGDRKNAVTPALQSTANACPSSYSDVPISGLDTLAVSLIEEQGGANVFDKFLPANVLILRAFRKRWPACEKARLDAGFPKIIEKNDGFDWSSECKPCIDEQRAIDENFRVNGFNAPGVDAK